MNLSNILSKHRLFMVTSTMLAVFAFLVSGTTTSAHTDPGACSSNGVGLSLTVFRADGSTPVGGGSIFPGETVKYQATLSNLGGSNCNYEGGTLSVTTPDGVVHVLASPATPVVPLVSTSTPYVSSQVSYVANSADVGGDGDLDSSADYTGGSSHTGENHDTASAHVDVAKQFAKLNPGITTQVHDPAHTDITNGTTTAGTAVHDKATLTASSTGPTPGGTVDFTLYSGLTCNGAVLSTQNNVSLVGGTIESNSTTTAPGAYSYAVHYDGDANYNEANAVCEPFSVAKLDPGITTQVHDPAHADITNGTTTVGTAVHDKIILTATSSGPTPGGTADFTLYSGLTCNGTVLSTQNNVAVSGGSAESNATTTAGGSYSYLAHYDGDENYNEATATCEPFTVFSQSQPTLNTTPNPSSGNVGATLNDSATLVGANAPTGNITFRLFPPSDASCQGAASYTQSVPLSGNNASTSPGFVSNVAGTWHWTAEYPGDINNAAASSTCQAEPVVISQPAGQWCSHGYWKQSHHFDSWVGYSPSQQFSSVFENAFPGKTLLQVLQQGGGGLNALGRDTVGELLNTAAGLSTGFTTAQIIANFNAVFPGSKSDYEALHATFVAPHNCPLN